MTNKADTQSMRDFLDHGRERDTQTAYSDGSRREPTWTPEADSPRPLAPSPFTKSAARK